MRPVSERPSSLYPPASQAQIECARLISEIQGGTYLEPNKTRVAQFLERWLTDVKSRVSPKTFERYEQVCRKNIVQLLGAVLLPKLKPAQISEAYAEALASGRRKGTGGLSPRTVRHMHVILKGALAQAVEWELLIRNPAGGVKPPKVNSDTTMQTYDLAQTAELIEVAARQADIHPDGPSGPLRPAARRDSSLTVAQRRSRDRPVGGSAICRADQGRRSLQSAEEWPFAHRGAVADCRGRELRARRIQQAQELLKVGKRLSDDDFVVAQADGSPLRPHSLGQEWVRFLATTTLPRIRFHDLRHTHATHMLKSGVHPKVASERLGHSKVGITLDLYSHVLPNMQTDAASVVDDALQAAIQKRRCQGNWVAKW